MFSFPSYSQIMYRGTVDPVLSSWRAIDKTVGLDWIVNTHMKDKSIPYFFLSKSGKWCKKPDQTFVWFDIWTFCLWPPCFYSSHLIIRQRAISMTWCKIIVTPSHLWRSYNSYAPSHRFLMWCRYFLTRKKTSVRKLTWLPWLHVVFRRLYLDHDDI